MFSIFKKKNLVTDIEWLGVDVHSHLLPGIDDGSPNVDQSVKLIKGLNDLGFSKFICTPHIFNELYPNTEQTILPALQLTKEALTRLGVDVDISAAAEYMVDETFEIGEGLMCLPKDHILIEMSYLNESPNIEQVIFDLQLEGYKVIVAHPERYVFYHNARQRFHRLKDMGVLFQMNLLSIVGYYGKEVKQATEYLISKDCYDLAGSDLHHDKHLQSLTKFVREGEMYKKIGTYAFKNRELFHSRLPGDVVRL
ncbi:MAG: CpsB/CapC family capsule biosynthesis tyrosine phosphatase [Pedobacter sp.]